MTTPLEQRVAAIESDLYRPGSGLHAQITANTESIRHLTNAVGDLSQQQRELRLDVREINGRLDGIDGRLDGMDGRLDGMDGRLDRLQRHAVRTDLVLGKILDHLGVTAPTDGEVDAALGDES